MHESWDEESSCDDVSTGAGFFVSWLFSKINRSGQNPYRRSDRHSDAPKTEHGNENFLILPTVRELQ